VSDTAVLVSLSILSHFSFWWTVSWQSFTLLPVWLLSSLSLSSFVLQNFLLPVNTSSTVDYFAAFSLFNSGFSSSKLLHTGLVRSILADQQASSTRPKTSSYVIIGHIKWTLSVQNILFIFYLGGVVCRINLNEARDTSLGRQWHQRCAMTVIKIASAVSAACGAHHKCTQQPHWPLA